MKNLADDYTQFQQGEKTGQLPANFEQKLTADAQQIDNLCTIGSK
jgi:hypothetical protein